MILYGLLFMLGGLIGLLEGIPWIFSLDYFSLQKDFLTEIYCFFQIFGAVIFLYTSKITVLILLLAFLAFISL